MAIISSNKDLDSSIIVIGIHVILVGFLVLLFISDFWFGTKLLTEAIIHSIFGFIAGCYSTIVMFHFRNKSESGNGAPDNESTIQKTNQS